MKTVIEMAREAGIEPVIDPIEGVFFDCYQEELERFAELVRADERARMAEQPAQQEPVALSWVNDDGFLRKKPTEQTAKQEPVAWIWEGRDGYATIELIDLDEQDMQNVSVKSMTPLYTSPQPAQRKPLTPDLEADTGYSRDERAAFTAGWEAAEAAHNIKDNT